MSLRQTTNVAKVDRLRRCLLGNDVPTFANPQFYFGTFHVSSRDALSLTAHDAHTAVSNPLISLDCHSYPSWGQYKACAWELAGSRSLNSSSRVQRANPAQKTVN
jgi:hypothetical protein